MADSIRLDGFDELDKAFNELPAQVQKNLARSVVRKAAKVIEDQAKANVPRGETGELAKGFVMRTTRDADGVEAHVTNIAFHAHLVELGHRIVTGRRGRKGKRGGEKREDTREDTGERVPEYPFIQPAFEARKEEALQILGDELEKGLARAIERHSKK